MIFQQYTSVSFVFGDDSFVWNAFCFGSKNVTIMSLHLVFALHPKYIVDVQKSNLYFIIIIPTEEKNRKTYKSKFIHTFLKH